MSCRVSASSRVGSLCDTALPRVYSKSRVSAHHNGKTPLALDGAPLLEPPIQHVLLEIWAHQSSVVHKLVKSQRLSSAWGRLRKTTLPCGFFTKATRSTDMVNVSNSTSRPLQTTPIQSLYWPSDIFCLSQKLTRISRLLSLASANNHPRM